MSGDEFSDRCGMVAAAVVVASVPLAVVAFALALALRAAGVL